MSHVMNHSHKNPQCALRLPSRLTSIRLASLVAATFLVGCTNPAAGDLQSLSGPAFIREVEGKLRVYNFQLRAIGDPCNIDDPNVRPSSAFGHLQLKVTALGDESVRVAYKGTIFNPAGEIFTGFRVQRGSGPRAPGMFVAIKEVDGRAPRIDPEDATIISAELAAALYGTPDTVDDPNLFVIFTTTQHPTCAIQGTHRTSAVQR